MKKNLIINFVVAILLVVSSCETYKIEKEFTRTDKEEILQLTVSMPASDVASPRITFSWQWMEKG
jgi:hypothetical protein